MNLEFDKKHLWHPYTSTINPLPVYEVSSAKGIYIKLRNGSRLIDGMSSWWCTIWGYNNLKLSNAARRQIRKMSHVMFGGLTHQPAIRLGEKLLKILPKELNKIFYCDSGSVSVEVAMKMALQYHGGKKTAFMTTRSGYHGDTWNAMSVCDPDGGMHSLWNGKLAPQIFVDAFPSGFEAPLDEKVLSDLEENFKKHSENLAAFIIEPVVQGAGGMRFYNPQYLDFLRKLCDKYNALLIFDEIATGFGRTGKTFALEHTDNTIPDIICLGKAITGGFMSFAATIATDKVAEKICSSDAGCFMHGPTFMGNPLACAVACESLNILKKFDLNRISQIESILKQELKESLNNPKVKDVRCLGAIGVVEMKEPVNMAELQKKFVENGVWIRPFGKLVYIMPPFIIEDKELKKLCRTLVKCI